MRHKVAGYKLKRDIGCPEIASSRAGDQRHRERAHRHHRSQGEGGPAAGGKDDHAGQAGTLHSRRQAASFLRPRLR